MQKRNVLQPCESAWVGERGFALNILDFAGASRGSRVRGVRTRHFWK